MLFLDSLLFAKYLGLRESVFGTDGYVFCTDEGKPYRANKFAENARRLFRVSGVVCDPYRPDILSEDQLQALLSLQFRYERPSYQRTLATALTAYLGLRPSEVAGLRKEDILLEEGLIVLRETKSQMEQSVPIPDDLRQPLARYLSHLKSAEALFVRNTGRQWSRRDVHDACIAESLEAGVGRVNPRQLRTAVACEMLESGIPINKVSGLLRHRDPATTLRHYVPVRDSSNLSRAINGFRRPSVDLALEDSPAALGTSGG